MKVLVTGAGGFLGRAVVSEALSAGHTVLAMHRPASAPAAKTLPAGVELVTGDLRQPGSWRDALGGIDAVIHCAAAASGDLPTQLAGTVLATENLLAALPRGLRRFVHISSFSVYDFAAPQWPAALDEDTPLERHPLRRDAYTQTKLQQERMIRAFCEAQGIALAVLRPGAIYGPGKDWDFGKALSFGPFDLIFAPLSRMRLIHVRNCAAAIVAALERPDARESIVNLVDDEQPTHWKYHHRARQAGASVGLAVPVPYLAVRALGGLAWLASKAFFHGRARLPEWLDLPRQQVRWRPMRYRNTKARHLFGESKVSLEQGMDDMVRAAARIGSD
jgi:nucleoside-diphosphate-sugar epimerase